MWLPVDFQMAAWVVKAAIVLDHAGLRLHVEVKLNGLLSQLVKSPFVRTAILAIEIHVYSACLVLFIVHKFEDLLVLLVITKHKLSCQSPKEEKVALDEQMR